MRLAQNAPCPCASGRRVKACCGPILKGAPAETPEALMRSRYTAYATGAIRHIQRTTHPEGPHFDADTHRWHRQIEAFCTETEFTGLTIHLSEANGDRGSVHFTASLVQNGEAVPLEEHSDFYRIDGRWLYHSGRPLP